MVKFLFVFGFTAYFALIDADVRKLFFDLVFTTTGGTLAMMQKSAARKQKERLLPRIEQ